MKKIFSIFLLAKLSFALSQVPVYYSSIDFTQTGMALKSQLTTLITNTHTSPISYSDVWDVLVTSDLDPTNSADVLLAYGYDDSDGSVINDRTRDKTNNGGSTGQWNREHTFANSQGNPDLGTVGPGSDAHNLRASDVQMNGNRGNLLFAAGSGDAGPVSSNWYPGDEWIGDCARIVMYMYLRYGLQCRPIYCASGSTNSIDANMVDILLTWNANDPVSQLEMNRNNIIQTWQGNRNPFIDNPSIATHIWGGPTANDPWGGLGLEQVSENYFNVYPVPSFDNQIYVRHSSISEIQSVTLYDEKGSLMEDFSSDKISEDVFQINVITDGVWILKIQTESEIITKKVIIL